MNAKCIHGIDPKRCATCRQASEREPLPPDPFRTTPDGRRVLLLRLDGFGTAKVLTGDGICQLKESELQPATGGAALREQLADVAARRGFLFVPHHPLTIREQREDIGPSHCYHCNVSVGLDMGSLGCEACRYYVCGCGRCLCGYTGRNWKNEFFSQLPPLPISREDRLEYLRAFRFLKAA